MSDQKISVPSVNTLNQAFKLSIQIGKPMKVIFT